ncbi:hypothetical protein [Pseudopedobacter beijingensis]|uniref:Ig-like domain-containing protein n=1 Tax=Pseudopedobacter beijingensis TaxID=1207056 RepID=A0ABW4IHX6_9SPHI
MKRKITLCSLAVLLLGAGISKAQQNFTADNLVIVRVGTGPTALTVNAAAAYLDEYTTAGEYVQTIEIPTTASGANHGFVVGGATGSTHGFGNLSPNGQYLAIAGHEVPVGSDVATLQASTTPKVIAIVSNGVSSPVINTSTAVNIDNKDNRTAITTDGNSIWFGGQTLGVQYTTVGSSTSVQLTGTPAPTRGGLGIYNGQLYQSTNQNPYRIAKIGDGLPTTATTATAVSGLEATGSNLPVEHTANGFVFFDVDSNVPGNDLLYFVTELGGGFLQKFVRTDPDNDVWANKGSVAGGSFVNMKTLTGTLVDGVPTLYAGSYNKIIKIVDNAAYTANLNQTVTDVITAGPNMAFRSLTFTPGTVAKTTLPVTLTSFTGKAEQNFVKLNWITSSEQNNSHFEVLRSTDGKSFNVIGNVKGNNNSDIAINYEFKDQNPLNVTAYYRLNQVDYDGKNKLSSVISVEPGLAVLEEFTVYTSAQSVVVRFNSALKSNGKIVIYTTAGQAIINKDIVIETGANEVILPAKGIKNGNIYVALLNAEGKIQSEKFIANNQ